MVDFKSELRQDQYKVLQAVTMPTEKTQTKQRNKTENQPKQKQTQNKQTQTTNKTKQKGRVISWSVRNVGKVRKGDSIVSSVVSS